MSNFPEGSPASPDLRVSQGPTGDHRVKTPGRPSPRLFLPDSSIRAWLIPLSYKHQSPSRPPQQSSPRYEVPRLSRLSRCMDGLWPECLPGESEREFTPSCPTLLRPHELWPTRLLRPWDFPDKRQREEVPKDRIERELRMRGPEICSLPAAAKATGSHKGFWARTLGLQIPVCQDLRSRNLHGSFHCTFSGPSICEVSQRPPMSPWLPVPPALPRKSSIGASVSSPDPAHLSAPFGRGNLYTKEKYLW